MIAQELVVRNVRLLGSNFRSQIYNCPLELDYNYEDLEWHKFGHHKVS